MSRRNDSTDEEDIDSSIPQLAVEKDVIYEVPKGCPICASDVKGNDFYKYFCAHCNVLFDRKDLVGKGKRGVRRTKLSQAERELLARKRKELSEKIDDKFRQKTEEVIERIEEPPIEEPAVEPEEEEIPEGTEEPAEETEAEQEVEEPAEEVHEEKKEEYELESEDRIIASSQSTKMHAGNCHFIRKIHPNNRLYLKSMEDGEEQGYAACVCLRRLKALKR